MPWRLDIVQNTLGPHFSLRYPTLTFLLTIRTTSRPTLSVYSYRPKKPEKSAICPQPLDFPGFSRLLLFPKSCRESPDKSLHSPARSVAEKVSRCSIRREIFQNEMAAATNLSQRPLEGCFIKYAHSRTFTSLCLRNCSSYSDHSNALKALMCAFGKDEVPGSNPGISSTRLAEMQVFFVVLR